MTNTKTKENDDSKNSKSEIPRCDVPSPAEVIKNFQKEIENMETKYSSYTSRIQEVYTKKEEILRKTVAHLLKQ